MKYHSRLINCFTATGVAALLVACGGGGGGGASTGSLSVGVTDAPVTEDVDVCIHFTGITLHHSDGDRIRIPYDPSAYTDATECVSNRPADNPLSAENAVNLSALQGELSVKLMESEEVKAGRYNWIRLDVDESLSYVMDSGGQQALSCPSCSGEQSGLKLNRGITVPAGGEADFIIDINLAKSLNKKPSGDYKMRPTLRLVDLSETGHIRGSVDATLVPELISDTDTGCSVYVYAGHGVTPDDYHDADNILTSAKVLYAPGSMTYKYSAAYLPTDTSTDPTLYTVALTCDDDDPEVDQDNDSSTPAAADVIFTDGVVDSTGQDTDVSTDETRVVDFPPGT
ncbi:MAG: DUF4382 domain-containing protein [Gammaproteobacteria bacterium]